MNLVRKLKICNIVPNSFNEKEREVISFLNMRFSYLNSKKRIDYPKSTFYINMSADCAFELYDTDEIKIVYVNRYTWDSLVNKYKISSIDIQKLIRYYIKKKFNINTSDYNVFPFKA